jgi:hypothetical protein
MVYALVDCVQDEEVERTSLPKSLWLVLIVVLPVAGPLAWLVVAKIARPRQGGPGSGRGSTGRRPVAPDDDPDFLRRLAEEQARRRRRESNRRAGGGQAKPPPPDAPGQPPAPEPPGDDTEEPTPA